MLPERQPLAWQRIATYIPALQYRDFRYLWASTAVNAMGLLGEQVALGWILLELTNSSLMVGVGFGIRMAPLFLMGLIAGAIADRVDRRRLLRLLSTLAAGMFACIGVLVYLELIQVWQLLTLTFLVGCVFALLQTARQSFVYDIVGPRNVVSGLSLTMLAMRAGGIVGALATGYLVAQAGVGVAYLALAACFLASALVLLLIHGPGQAAPIQRLPVLEALKQFFSELRHNRALFTLFLLTAGVEIMGFSHQVILPQLARDVLGVGVEGLGIMNALRAAGGIIAIAVLTLFGEVRRKGLIYLLVLHLFGAALILLGSANTFVVAMLVVALINGAGALTDILSQSMMQIVVSNELRGRAMGSWVLAIGTAPLGSLQVGALAAALGATFALTVNGIGLLVLAAGSMAFFPRLRRQ